MRIRPLEIHPKKASTSPVTQPRQLVPKMHIRPSSEKVDGWFLLVQEFGVFVVFFNATEFVCEKPRGLKNEYFFQGVKVETCM